MEYCRYRSRMEALVMESGPGTRTWQTVGDAVGGSAGAYKEPSHQNQRVSSIIEARTAISGVPDG